MAKFAPATTLDAELDFIAASDRIFVCSTQPTTYAEASTTFNLATVTAVALTDFPRAAGTGTGARQVSSPAKTGASVTTSGTAAHLAYCVAGSTSLRYVTTITTSQALTAGNTVNLSAFVLVNKTQPT